VLGNLEDYQDELDSLMMDPFHILPEDEVPTPVAA
jgi:hypothetical protein